MRYKLARFFAEQTDAVHEALLPLAFAVGATALLVWLLTRWRYRRLLARAGGEHDDWRTAGDATWDAVEPVGAGLQAGFTPDAADRAQRKALRAITNALDSAGPALASGGSEDVNRAIPIMGMALTLARSAFDLPIPVYGPDAHANLLTSTQWLEHVRPALRAGNVEEARRRSAEFLRLNGLQPG